MSTTPSNRTANFDKGRGSRLKRFRQDVMDKTQKELVDELGFSQSKLSMIERGQMPDQDVIDYYTAAGINWHWAMTGTGAERSEAAGDGVEESAVNYDTLSGNINHLSSQEPIDQFFHSMSKLKEEVLIKMRGSTNISEEELDILTRQLVNKVEERFKELKKAYP